MNRGEVSYLLRNGGELKGFVPHVEVAGHDVVEVSRTAAGVRTLKKEKEDDLSLHKMGGLSCQLTDRSKEVPFQLLRSGPGV